MSVKANYNRRMNCGHRCVYALWTFLLYVCALSNIVFVGLVVSFRFRGK